MKAIPLIFMCILAIAGCRSSGADQAFVEQAEARISEQAKKDAQAIQEKASAESRFLCEHSIGKKVGTPDFDRCVKDAYRIKILAVLQERETQRRRDTADILSSLQQRIDADNARHGTINCYQAFGSTRCNY